MVTFVRSSVASTRLHVSVPFEGAQHTNLRSQVSADRKLQIHIVTKNKDPSTVTWKAVPEATSKSGLKGVQPGTYLPTPTMSHAELPKPLGLRTEGELEVVREELEVSHTSFSSHGSRDIWIQHSSF